MSPLALYALSLLGSVWGFEPQAPAADEAWQHFKLDNGIQVTVVHAPDAPQQSLFTFLPLGLLADDADRAQYAHLVEHMLIRSTDPDGLIVDGLKINGETQGTSMRLESIGDPDRFPAALERHARWVMAREFDAEVMEREKGRIQQEEQSTVQNQATHKWAMAGWNQIVRHKKSHAAVHGDVAGATVEMLASYVEEKVKVGPEVLVVAVGPLTTQEVLAAIEEHFALLDTGEPAPVARSWDGQVGDYQGTWDLGLGHYVEWYPLPDRTPSDRAAAQALVQVINMRLRMRPKLSLSGTMVMPSADWITPEGRFLAISAPLGKKLSAEQLRDEIRLVLDEIHSDPQALPQLESFLESIRAEMNRVPDFGELRKQYKGRPGLEFLEAQMVLGHSYHRLTTGLQSSTQLTSAYDALTPELFAEVVKDALEGEKRSTLVLMPAK